jgi:hypothetical protein
MKPMQKIKTSALHCRFFFFFSYIVEDDNESKGWSSSSIGLFWVLKDDNEPHGSSLSLGFFPCCVITVYLI